MNTLLFPERLLNDMILLKYPRELGCSGLEHTLAAGGVMKGCKEMAPKKQNEDGENGG